MNTTLKALTTALSMLALTTVAASADAAPTKYNGTLSTISVMGNNHGIARVAFPSGSRPGCHTRDTNHLGSYAFDINTAKGQGMLKLLQTALLNERTVLLVGSTSCTNIGAFTIETLTEVTLF